MAAIIPCPQCRQSLGVPEPPPARIRCPKCSTIIVTQTAASSPKPGAAAGPMLVSVPVPAPAAAPQGIVGKELVPVAVATAAPPARPMPAAPPMPARAVSPNSRIARTAFVVGAGTGVIALLVFLIAFVATGRGKDRKVKDDEPAVDKEDSAPPLRLNSGDSFDELPRRTKLAPAVEKCIEDGVAYLRTQVRRQGRFHLSGDRVEPGRIALIGLTLLECDVPADDGDVQYAAQFVRSHVADMKTTYTAAPAILFLDRLNRGRAIPANDRALIQTLTLRLVAGQTRPLNLWNYKVPILDGVAASNVLRDLETKGMYEGPGPDPDPPDLSSSQFAALALWTARRYKLPVLGPLRAAGESIRKYQLKDGSWPYHITSRDEANQDTGTCVGLILLALGQAARDGKQGKFLDDPDVKKALANLGTIVNRPHEKFRRTLGDRFQSKGDLYFLWTLERTALILDQQRIGDKDWHAWGTDLIVSQQKPGGFWAEKYDGPVDTCFALLFLVRADLFRDLTIKLQQLALLEAPVPRLG